MMLVFSGTELDVHFVIFALCCTLSGAACAQLIILAVVAGCDAITVSHSAVVRCSLREESLDCDVTSWLPAHAVGCLDSGR